MTLEEFRQIHNRYQQEKPKLFLLSNPDRTATEAQLRKVECDLGVKLSGRLREFLTDFGGGLRLFQCIFC
ncbi:SMI1/KNR4 family protein [Allochromatium vinosum]|uniref:SMI1/KNR4 family protein n=1 Tax=Allochromatium vinosum TaxID=1049 RepID=UPI001907978E|nr:SMI1/KNR4 family protein [Allochromatium vinosum]